MIAGAATGALDAVAGLSAPTAEPAARVETARSEVELTILMPCLNEAETLGTCITKALDFLRRANVAGEVLIADNGSTDGSREIAERLGARVVPVKERGYGAALIGGIAAARGTYVIMGDADDSYDLQNLTPFLEQLRAGNDLVMGNRFRGGIEQGAMPFLHRYLGNPVLSYLGRLFFAIPVSDFHCGLRGFRRDKMLDLKLRSPGMEFASEMVVRSSLRRHNIAEVPTTLKPDGRSRAPHLRTWRDGWRHLKFLLMYTPKWLFFIPGAILTALGAALGMLLMMGPVSTAFGVVLDLNSFLAACMITIIGVQLLTFGALARSYASLIGMLPVGPHSRRIAELCTTDRLATLALALLIVGASLFGLAVLQWARVGFGDLVSPLVPRLVVAGLSIMVIAVQTGFAGFLFGVLELGKRQSQ